MGSKIVFSLSLSPFMSIHVCIHNSICRLCIPVWDFDFIRTKTKEIKFDVVSAEYTLDEWMQHAFDVFTVYGL